MSVRTTESSSIRMIRKKSVAYACRIRNDNFEVGVVLRLVLNYSGP